jgi:DNA mismatch repair protein MutS
MTVHKTDSKDTTPLMRQYFEIKSKYKDVILLYRMGDFYETFEEDARTVHKVLGITLTKRANGKAAHVALAGFPYHALDTYMPKLIRAGYRVAVCEQVEDPKTAKGIVRRDVTEIVTPGTVLSDKLLDHKTNNYLMCIHSGFIDKQTRFGVAIIEASTGQFFAGELSDKELTDYMRMYVPVEIVVPVTLYESIKKTVQALNWPIVISRQEDWLFHYSYAYDILVQQFNTHSLKGFGLQDQELAISAAGAVLHYLKETQKFNLSHINRITLLQQTDHMFLDSITLRNLEILSTTKASVSYGGLIDILDHTKTPMGGRLLKHWLLHPLVDADKIKSRLDAVEHFINHSGIKEKTENILKDISDLERLITKICAMRAHPREVRALSYSLDRIPFLVSELKTIEVTAINRIQNDLIDLTELTDEIDKALVEDPSIQIKDGEVIRSGYHEELDTLRSIAYNGKNYIAQIQNRERERTGIPSLKIQYNQVFGYYIEITHTHKDKVPSDYIRKQTMVNAERFITPELKEYEEQVLNAEEKINKLEQELFDRLRKKIIEYAASIQQNAARIAELDCYLSFAQATIVNKYIKPVISDSDEIRIVDGRHPVVEKLLPPDEPFIPNDLLVNTAQQILIITGPNMAGKSCYLRQAGLIVLMAQSGCFVPAKKAEIGLVDKIFTRVGASDNMLAGESTFLVEMNETANILNNTTKRSLILLDEIGRGTSTFDGLSIAWAVVEYLHNHPVIRPKTLFATHYHELVEIEDIHERIKNFHMEVHKYNDKIVFVRKLLPGGCDHSYGIEVAKLAGLPPHVIGRAQEVMQNLESHNISAHKDKTKLSDESRKSEEPPVQLTFYEDGAGEKIKRELNSIDIDMLTPFEALNKLYQLKIMLNNE